MRRAQLAAAIEQLGDQTPRAELERRFSRDVSGAALDVDPVAAAKRLRSLERATALSFEQAGRAHLFRGENAAAIDRLGTCLALAALPSCHRQLGMAHLNNGDRVNGAVHLRRYLELRPTAKDATQVRDLLRKAMLGPTP